MNVIMIALGVYGSTGGLQAFNARVIRCLGAFLGNRVASASVVSLWDTPRHSELVPRGVRFFGGQQAKIVTAVEFLRQVRRSRPDIVLFGHVMLVPLSPLVRVLSPRTRQVLLVHGTEVWDDPSFRVVPRYEVSIVRATIDAVASVSDYTAARMSNAFKLEPTRFRRLINATDIELPRFTRTRDKRTRLLTVCRLESKDRYKGVDKVILAMPRILDAVPGAEYTVVGPGPLRFELERLAAKLGVLNRVHFRGRVDDEVLCAAYRDADVFVMPSTGEGFGIVFLEAWKHGLPVICGNRDASCEVVTDGKDGVVIDPSSVASIADAVIELLTNRYRADTLATAGLRKVSTAYSHVEFKRHLEGVLTGAASLSVPV